ncbi:MAG: hypothetical protein M1825_004557 [Sarcosagium campestre]|nr:MAG: hypothetical protein M1825_004557 [Sarcosagium campestre]
MSGTAALEYGFPSTHSTNAVSVAVYMLFMLHSPATNLNETARTFLKVASYCYASSIILGRLYCGMHGFADVIVGGALGAFLSTVQCVYGEMLDNLLYSGSSLTPLLIILFICFLVRIHPEPVDDCPCFDDSVAFAGVMIGVELGNWHYSTSGWAWNDPVPATVPYSLETLGWMKSIARVIFGVLTILAWREMMKPTLLRGLPPLFRVIERLGLNLPRRFFVLASEYEKVPTHLKDDNVVPSVSEFPSLITSMRHPRRRAISIGPQSAADVYETLAHRDKTRRESGGGGGGSGGGSSGVSWPKRDASTHASAETRSAEDMHSVSSAALSRVHSREKYTTAQDGVLYTPISEAADPMDALHAAQEVASERRKEAQADREMFSNLEKPRVRYDVEVVTKLIVYTGIALLAVEINPMLFETVGLGMS